jgi:hypothetical protein
MEIGSVCAYERISVPFLKNSTKVQSYLIRENISHPGADNTHRWHSQAYQQSYGAAVCSTAV